MIASLDGPAFQSWSIFSNRPLFEIRSEAVQWRAELRIVVGCSVACGVVDRSRLFSGVRSCGS